MNIVHCVFEMEIGGSQVLVADLLNEMCTEHTVSLVIINRQFNESLLGQISSKVSIYHLNRRQGSYNPVPFIRLNRLLGSLRPHIIHCHEYTTSRFIRVSTARLVNTIHAIGLPVTYYHHYHLLVAISAAVHNDVRSRCSYAVKTIDNGINFGCFTRRTSYGADENGCYKLVQVGRLEHLVKGQDILLRALACMVFEYGIRNISLDFIGSGESLGYLQGMTQQLGLGDYVHFKGEKERSWIFNRLANYHLLVQPSRFEGFGLTMLEGLAAGLPVLAADVFGPAEILQGLPGAFLFAAGDAEGCASQISRIIDLYHQGRAGLLADQSLKLVNCKYAMQSCAAAYLHTYEQLLSEG